MTYWQFALRSLFRDLRAGELTVLVLAMVVAVASMTAVDFFTDRVGRAIKAQASATLAADIVIQSPNPIDPAYLDEARALGLDTAEVLGFPSVVRSGPDNSLAMISAASSGYPLRGRLLVSDELFGTTRETRDIPAVGTAWAEPGLLARLGLNVGAKVKVGALNLNIARVLEFRPDQNVGGFLNLQPALLVNLSDVPAMEVVQVGSRVSYRQLYGGNEAGLKEFRAQVTGRLSRDQRIRDLGDAGEQITAAIDRAQRFLTLASLVTLILAAVATAMAARRYALRHLDTVALLKSLGATQRFIQGSILVQLIIITLGATLIGTAIGFSAQFLLTAILADLMRFELPTASLWAGALGLVTAAVIAIGFAVPHLFQLKTTPPLRVLRHDLAAPPLRAGLVYGVAIGALVVMIYVIVRDFRLLALIVVGLVGTTMAAVIAGWCLVRALTRFRGAAGVAWRYGLANVSRRGRESVVQIVAFGLGLMVLLLLSVVRNDLLQEWQRTLPDDAPNYFMINIRPESWLGISALLERELGTSPDFLPLIRGRMTRINNQPIEDIEFTNPRGRSFGRREMNLTWAATLPESNRVRAGRWWGSDYDGPLQISLDEDVARDMGVKLGDKVTFNVGGEEFTAPLTSLRFIEWDSFAPNFYFVLSPGEVGSLPQTYLSSVYVPMERRQVLNQLLQKYPGITLLDLEVVLAQVRSVVDKASLAVQYVFLFTLLAGLVVLLAAIQITRDERRFESALLHTLGARRSKILQGIAVEFIALGSLAGLLAALGATAVGWVLAENLFDLDYRIDPLLWVIGFLVGAVIVGLTGTLATRKAVNEPPILVLRKG